MALSSDSRTTPADLHQILHGRFGLAAFRPHQEEVCEAVVGGEDALVVMPTGAGKSLCYQLPGLAREGTTLVISPLIALMEDQVAKLQALGLAAERIHSGRDRMTSREVCRQYLRGELDYLFIAPERLAVPGFPEMLAKRVPALVAVDEAHCISHWGHDFRPEYRMLGERLPLLRPAPVIALTATATPQVQDDIARQLGLGEPEAGLQNGLERFICGFRRTNIAVEVVQLPPSARAKAVEAVLAEEERRPAIVYAPTRREAEELGAALGEIVGGGDREGAAAYHAGLAPAERERVQAAFQAGELEVVVATIAFGMGIDKADVRTVLHTGLPGSLEAYYQEIGRAGRDGLPSRALLLYSWADRRTHEFFHGRDYPEPDLMERVFRSLPGSHQPAERICQGLGLDPELFHKVLEKLWVHGGARVTPEETVARGEESWRAPYNAQRNHKLDQLASMVRFAEGKGCRMAALVEHFGDREDGGAPCGLCDQCAPDACALRRFRGPSREEELVAEAVVDLLRERDNQSTGRLFRQVEEASRYPMDRKGFEAVLGALSRAELVEVEEDGFEKNGQLIRFERARLTDEGYRCRVGAFGSLEIAEDIASTYKRSKSQKGGKKGSSRGKKAADLADAPPELVESLKAWRLGEARRRKVPAFRILTDRTLHALAAARPTDQEGLLAISGIGSTTAKNYGADLLELVAE